jgi:hypothetical protein
MGGDRIKNAKLAVKQIVNSLPANSAFNIIKYRECRKYIQIERDKLWAQMFLDILSLRKFPATTI